MHKTSNFSRNVTAAFAAVLVSFAFIGAAVGPAQVPGTSIHQMV